jgi:iduronate 2-sulfatase
LLDDPSASWDKPAFTQVWRGTFPGHSVRSERFRYIEWDNGRKGAQLYDYATDPQEHHNLIDDPRHASVVAELRRILRDHWRDEYRPNPGAAIDLTL